MSDFLHHMDYNLPGSSVHWIFQSRILECIAISFSRAPQPSDQTHISSIADIGRQILYCWATLFCHSLKTIFKIYAFQEKLE